MTDEANASQAARLDDLRKAYAEILAPVVEEFLATVHSEETVGPFSGEGLVGLLTFPNSGTSWFLRLTVRASGICNHTAYEKESVKSKGQPNRGAFTIRFPLSRLPEPGEPSFIKSHVQYYGQQATLIDGPRAYARHLERWRTGLPPGCDRHVRLVRNPLDNLRARYHLRLKDLARNGIDADPADRDAFRAYFRPDLRRYLQWHACCDDLARSMPVMALRYEEFLRPETAPAAIGRAMRFAGYSITDAAIETAIAKEPPKYVSDAGMPIHLGHYDEDDIRWVAAAMREWIALYRDILEGRSPLATRLRRLIRRAGSPG